jgi:hypothetical protein
MVGCFNNAENFASNKRADITKIGTGVVTRVGTQALVIAALASGP